MSWQQGRRHLVPLGNRTRTSAVGARHNHNHRATNHCCVTNLTVNLMPLPQPRTDPWHIPLLRCCSRHFSLPHHAQGFSRINLHDSRNSPPTKTCTTVPALPTCFFDQIGEQCLLHPNISLLFFQAHINSNTPSTPSHTKSFKDILGCSQKDKPTSPHPFPSKFYPQYPLTLLQPILNPIPANLTS